MISKRRKLQLVASTQKRKMLCKTRKRNSSSQYASLSYFFIYSCSAFGARDQISRLVTNQSPEPVDETMSGNPLINYKN